MARRKLSPNCEYQVRLAIYHLVLCWDALREAEGVLGKDIEVEQITGAASNCGIDSASDAFSQDTIPSVDLYMAVKERSDRT